MTQNLGLTQPDKSRSHPIESAQNYWRTLTAFQNYLEHRPTSEGHTHECHALKDYIHEVQIPPEWQSSNNFRKKIIEDEICKKQKEIDNLLQEKKCLDVRDALITMKTIQAFHRWISPENQFEKRTLQEINTEVWMCTQDCFEGERKSAHIRLLNEIIMKKEEQLESFKKAVQEKQLKEQMLYEQYENLKKKNEKLNKTVDELRLSAHIRLLNEIIMKKEEQLESFKKAVQEKQLKEQMLYEQYENLKKKNEKLNKTVDELRLRITERISENLTKGNTSIENLSDPNRRTKLGERYSELYDNQWTDAYEELVQIGFSNESSITELLLILQNSCVESSQCKLKGKKEGLFSSVWNQFLEKMAKSQKEKQCIITNPNPENNEGKESSVDPKMESNQSYENTENENTEETKTNNDNENPGLIPTECDNKSSSKTLNDEKTPDQGTNQNKEKISSSEQLDQNLGHGDMESDQNKEEKESNEQASAAKEDQIYVKTRIFAEECIKLCWKMVTKEPPMHLKFDFEGGEKFNTKLLRPYTKNGDLFAYLVWPPLFDYKSGHLMKAGIAQAKTNMTTQQPGTT